MPLVTVRAGPVLHLARLCCSGWMYEVSRSHMSAQAADVTLDLYVLFACSRLLAVRLRLSANVRLRPCSFMHCIGNEGHVDYIWKCNQSHTYR